MLSRIQGISRLALRTDKIRKTLVRESRLRGSDPTPETSLLCDVLP